jgi:hypothetical protein
MKIIIRLYDAKGSVIKRITGSRENWRKMYAKLASAVAQKYLVRVEYGIGPTAQKTREMFFNEYEGSSLSEAKVALKAFLEK